MAASLGLAACGGDDDTGWVIERFDVGVRIDGNGVMRVRETIDVDFRDLEKHGIFRDIPFAYTVDDDRARSTTVIAESVTDAEGLEHPWIQDTVGSYRRLRIGSASVIVTGKQTYVIEYRVIGALNPFDDHGEFFWNVTGDQWPVPIESSSLEVRLPLGTRIERVACYEGASGSTDSCGSAEAGGSGATFRASRALDAGEGWTAVVAFPNEAVSVPPLNYIPRPPEPPEPIEASIDWWYPAGAVAVFLFVAGRAAVTWFRFGRDQRDDNGPVVVEYGPPDDLRPAEMAFLREGAFDSDSMAATLVDLAARGYIGIEARGDEHVFTLRNLGDDLKPYETMILDRLFEKNGDDEVTTAELRKRRFYVAVDRAGELLGKQATKQHWYTTDPAKAAMKYDLHGWSFIGWGIFGIIGLAISLAIVGPLAPLISDVPLNMVLGGMVVCGGLIAGGAVQAIFAHFMPARSRVGTALLHRVEGFKKFLSTADASRQRFYEEQGIFERYLPYAMVLGVVDRWERVFADLGVPFGRPVYLSSPEGGFSIASAASSFSGSVGDASERPAPPSSSGGSGSSGFSSSGSSSFSSGSSGGGTGGGGGGSW